MTKFNSVQNSFKSGIISERYFGRFDDDVYQSGVARADNFIAGPQGGMTKRPGSFYLGEIPNTWEPQILEFYRPGGNWTIIVNKKGGDNTVGGAASGYTSLRIYDPSMNLKAYTANASWDLPSAHTLPDLVTYTEHYNTWQYGDTLWLVASNGKVMPISITYDPLAGTFDVGQLGPDRAYQTPYQKRNASATTFTVTKPAADYILTSSVAKFTATMVGSGVVIHHTNISYMMYITGYTSSTVVTVVGTLLSPALSGLVSAGASDNWQLSFWSNANGYPQTVVGYQERAIFGGSPAFPDTVWCSQTGNPEFLMNMVLDQDAAAAVSNLAIYYGYYGAKSTDHPFNFRPSSDRANQIRWMNSSGGLAIGTSACEYIVTGSDGQFGFDKIKTDKQSAQGGSNVTSQSVGSASLFVSKDLRSIYSYFYFRDNGSYIARELTKFTEVSAIVESCVVQNRRAVFFRGTELYCLVYDETGRTAAMSKLDFGGTLKAIGTVNDNLFIIVSRTIDETVKFYVEQIARDYGENANEGITDDLADGYPGYCDSYINVSAPGSTTVTGLSTLEAEEVVVVADGNYKGTFTVSGGEIELDADDYTYITVGLAYTATLQTLPINYGGVAGPSTGTFKRVTETIPLLYRTRTLKCGSKEATLDSVKFDDTSTTVLYTGEAEVRPRQSPNTRGQLFLVSDLPYPCHISSLVQKGETYD